MGADDPGHEVRPLRRLRADQVMSRRVVSIDGGATAAQACRRMRDERVSSLIVERRDPHDAYGVVTRTDVVRKVVIPGLDPDGTLVHQIMTKPLVTVTPGLAIKFCLNLMEMCRIRRVAVFDGEAVIGLLSHADVLAALRV